MNIIVFAGPTISANDSLKLLDATFLPPAAQGDVYRAATQQPAAICIIDGTFERAPAIWHKEILWALSQGIHVFGASSMGALRAAELAHFGMVGVGTIFEWFREGTLEDDDEVAVAHAGVEHGYRVSSEAMVNIRATMAAAVRAGALDEVNAETLLGLAKQLYYPERSYAAVFQAARGARVAERVLDSLSAFLSYGKINQKLDDARMLLGLVNQRRPALATRFVPQFYFEHTETWHQVTSAAAARGTESGTSTSSKGALLAEELRLRGVIRLMRRGAHLRALGKREATRSGFLVTDEQRDLLQDAFRRERGLEANEAIWEWLSRNDLSERDFGHFLSAEAEHRWFLALYADDSVDHLTTELIASGQYQSVMERVKRKQAFLLAHGLESPDLSETGLTFEGIVEWYFRERLGEPVPANLQAHLQQVGLEDTQRLCHEAVREYLFLQFEERSDKR